MSEKKSNFVSLVRNKAVKWPTERGFDERTWSRGWEGTSENYCADRDLYEAGIVFNQILSELRKEIDDLYSNSPNIASHEMIKAYCGIANRDRAIIKKPDISRGFDITALRTSSNVIGNELSFQEIADGCVDAIETAIRSMVKKPPKILGKFNGMDAFEFMQKEAAISQLYGAYEDYWRTLVWGDYVFSKIAGVPNAYKIEQAASEFNVSYEASQIRKQKLLAETISTNFEPFFLEFLGKRPCLAWARSGKKKTLVVKPLKELQDIYQVNYISFVWQTEILFEHLPKEFLSVEHNGQGYSVLDLLEVFKLLFILSLISLDQFPEDDSVYTLSKAIRFCPTLSRDELLRGIRQATGFEFAKCTKMLEFLTFNGDRDKDLWCHPVVNLGKCQLTYLVAALASPVLLRVVEHWLAKMSIDLAEKGKAFEQVVIGKINEALKENSLFQDHSPAVSRRIKLGECGEEEIDLLFRFGNTVIVGELKSIVVTDSAISLYRTKSIIAGAAEQVKRKAEFMANNINATFAFLGWNFDKNKDYKVIPLVVTSNGICVGYSVGEVPVCDIRILVKYFSSNIIPLISASKSNHIAWFKIYDGIEEAQLNIKTYLRFPPQLTLSEVDFELVTCQIPTLSVHSPKIAYRRLVKKETNIEVMITRNYKFPLLFSDNLRELISNCDAII